MIKLYGVSASPFVRKVLAVLHLKGLEYEQIQQMPFAADEEYKKISPLGKIPALVDGDVTVCDSKVICEYLNDVYPDTPVYPSNAADHAQARWLEELGGNQLAEAASGIFFQRVMRPMAFKQDADEELVEKLITKKLPPLLNYLESEVPADGYLFGDLSVADISLVTQFVNASFANYQIDGEKWPQFAAYAERVKDHPVMAELIAADKKLFGLS